MTLENFRKIRIILNHADDPVLQKIYAKEGDESGRTLEVQLSNNGAIQNVKGTKLLLYWKHLKKGNNGNLFFDAADDSRGLYTVDYPDSMMYPGRVSCHIAIVSDDKITRTREFLVLVEGSGFEAYAEIASNDFQAANDMLIEFVKYQDKINEIAADLKKQGDSLRDSEKAKFEQLFSEIRPKIDGLESQFNDAIANLTQDSEVITARTSTETGEGYETIGKRLDDIEAMTVMGRNKAYFESNNGKPRLRLEEF